jgi:hypothetical protein
MDRFRLALMGQALWYVAASAFNLLSYQAINAGATGWAGDQPLTAQAVATVFALATLFGFLGWASAYRISVPIAAVLLFVGGVLRHLFADAADYSSQITWVLAIAINVIGVLAFILGSVSAFDKR